MKTVTTIEEFTAGIDNSKEIIIYGAGWAGQVVCRFLRNHKILVAAYAVTTQTHVQKLDGLQVYCLDDVISFHWSKDTIFILAVTKMHRRAMEEELEKRGVNAIVCSEALLYDIAKENRIYIAREAGARREKRSNRVTVGYLSPGYLDSDYAERRLIINKIEGITYSVIPKETANITHIENDREDKMEIYRELEEACYCPGQYIPEVDLIHTFNTVCRTDKPWCASFETSIPRMRCESERDKEYYLKLIEYMKRSNCKALYALCRNAYEMQYSVLKDIGVSSDDVNLLMSKTKILHPPQKVLVSREEFVQKHNTKKVRFIFIGRFFFIKGGREIIDTLSEFEDKYDFSLTLISSLLYDDYFTRTSYEEMLKYRKIIRKKRWIEYYESLPNEDVLEKCKEATVGLLPSVAETYGYAVLEMQAAGCPVVTTNIRAFPEINNEECGWVCCLPVDSLGCCAKEDTEIWSSILRKGLRRCFQNIFDHPEEIRKKGEKSLERIRKMHNPYEYQKELWRLVMIKVSVVIPVYNCENYIKQCIQSVLRQSLKELEILCIDDGSTDHSSQIIKRLQAEDARILLFHQENQGAGVARNLAIRKAAGKYIAFLDADDYYIDENALELMIYTCESKDLAVCGSLRKRRREGIEETETLFQGIATDKEYAYRDFQLDYNYQSFIFQKSHLIENGIFFPDYRRFQDPPFLVKALYSAGRFAVADTYLYCYRASDMTLRFDSQKVVDLLRGLLDNLRFAKEHNLEILFRNTAERLDDEYVDIICRNLSVDDSNVFTLLIQANQLVNEFYGKESGVIQPLRTLAFCMNQYPYRRELLDRVKRQDKIALYGAGKYGRLFLEFLKRNQLQSRVKCFIVSDLKGNKSQIEGIPVIELADFVKEKKDFVFITVRGGFWKEIKQILDRQGYRSYEVVKEEFLHVIAAETG